MSPTREGRRPELRLAKRGGLVEMLRLLTPLYGGIVSSRNSLYDCGLLRSHRAEVPVISAGNLSTGGTGKTPFVVWVIKTLRTLGFNPGVLSRGYGRADGAQENDEGALLNESFPHMPQVQRPDRVAGAAELVKLGADVIVLDDGFQHRRLARDLDIVLIDSTQPWGLAAASSDAPPLEALLPRGLLRESAKSLARADAIVLTRCDQSKEADQEAILSRIRSCAPDVPVARAVHRPTKVMTPEGEEPPSWLRGRPVCLVSGVGNPAAFEATARSLGADVQSVHTFADHHSYTAEELEGLCEPASTLLVTAKDAVKLRELGLRCSSLEVEFELIEGAEFLIALIESKLCGVHGG
jgi:tetraacyldisaccharide 4'-kinase